MYTYINSKRTHIYLRELRKQNYDSMAEIILFADRRMQCDFILLHNTILLFYEIFGIGQWLKLTIIYNSNLANCSELVRAGYNARSVNCYKVYYNT